MTWTYDVSDLDKTTSSGRVNVVRFLVGDTDTSDQQVQNEEITFALSESSDNVYFAASYIAYAIASKYARRVDIELDEAIKESLSDLKDQYTKLALTLKQNATVKSGGIGAFAGGITKTFVESKKADTGFVQPSFYRDRFRYPNNETQDLSYDTE